MVFDLHISAHSRIFEKRPKFNSYLYCFVAAYINQVLIGHEAELAAVLTEK